MEQILTDMALFAASLARSLDEAATEGRYAVAHALEHGLLVCATPAEEATLCERGASLSEYAWLGRWHTEQTRGWNRAVAFKRTLS